MLLLVPVLGALVVALLRGGSLRALGALPLRGSSAILASLAIQLALYLPRIRDAAFVLDHSGTIYILALVVALGGALANWHLGRAIQVATLGLALNLTVISANGGAMPVNAAALRLVQGAAKVHSVANPHLYNNTHLATRSARLVVLSDIIPVRLPGGRGNVYSLGDALLAAGVAALAYRATMGSAPGSRRSYPRRRSAGVGA